MLVYVRMELLEEVGPSILYFFFSCCSRHTQDLIRVFAKKPFELRRDWFFLDFVP